MKINTDPTNPANLCYCANCKGRAKTARACFNARRLAARPAGNKLAMTGGLLALLGFFLVQHTSAASADQNSPGYLEVFSSTQQTQWGEGSYYNVHTAYQVFDASGNPVKYVPNHDDATDEAPTKVELAPGTYLVLAESDRAGLVKTRVVVKPYQTTALHLESTRERSTKCDLCAADAKKESSFRE
jgi:hypothetical protein